MNRAAPLPDALDWGDLQFFLAVAETGSIQAGATRLAVNHSTVLRRLGTLERQLGARLFDRLPGGYALTAAGNHLAEHLQGLSEQLDSAERQVRGLDTALSGAVRVTSSDIVVEGLLMPLFARFRQRHPQVQLQLVMNYTFAALSRSEADLAVRGADDAPGHLVARPVGQVESVLCAAESYLAATGHGLPPERQRWVVVEESMASGQFERWFRSRFADARVVMRVDSLVALADAVAHGVGVGFLPRPLIDGRPGLVELAPPERALRRPIWVLMHPDVQHTARVRALFGFLVAALEADTRLNHGGRR